MVYVIYTGDRVLPFFYGRLYDLFIYTIVNIVRNVIKFKDFLEFLDLKKKTHLAIFDMAILVLKDID